MFLPGPDLHLVGLQALWDFCSIFLPNPGEDQQKSYMSAGSLALCHMLNPSLLQHYIRKKVTCEPELPNFRIKTLTFTRVIRLN